VEESHWYVDVLCAASLGVVQGMGFVEKDRSAFGFESAQQLLVWRLLARIKVNFVTAVDAALKHTLCFIVVFYAGVHLANFEYFSLSADDYGGSTTSMALAVLLLAWELFMCGCVTCFSWEFARDCVEVYATQLPSVWLDDVSNEQVASMLAALKTVDKDSLQQRQLVFTAFGRVAANSCHCSNAGNGDDWGDGTFEALFVPGVGKKGECAWEVMVNACVKELKQQVKKPRPANSSDEKDEGTPHYEPGQSDDGPQYRVGWTPLAVPQRSRQFAPAGQHRKDAVARFTDFVNKKHRALKVWSTPSSTWFAPELTQSDVLALLQGRKNGSFLVHMYEPGIASEALLASEPDPDPRTSYSITVARDSVLNGDGQRSASHWTGTIVQDENGWFQLLEAPDKKSRARYAVEGISFDNYNALDDHIHNGGGGGGGGSGGGAAAAAAAENKVSSLALLVDRYARKPYQLPKWTLDPTRESRTIFGALQEALKKRTMKSIEKYKGMIYESPTWECDTCTYREGNTLDLTKCGMCGAPRKPGNGAAKDVEKYTPPWEMYRTSIVVIRTMSVLVERAESAFLEHNPPIRRALQVAEHVLKDVVSALLGFKVAIDKDTFAESVGKRHGTTNKLIDVVLDKDNVELHAQPGSKTGALVGQDYGIQAELDAALVRVICSFPERVASLLSTTEIKNPKQRKVLRKMLLKIRPTLNALMTEGARIRFDDKINAHAWS